MKKVVSLISFLVLFIFMSSCAGTGDWNFELPNDYEVWHINSSEILIKCTDLENPGEKIPSFVKEFSYDDRYVFSRNIEDVTSNNVLNEIYYALDTLEKKVYGPYKSIEELQKQADEWNVEIPERWYRTSPDPNMSK